MDKDWKSDLELQIQFLLEDFEGKTNNSLITELKLVLLYERETKKEIKYTIKKWLFIGIVLGMAFIRLLEFILPNV